MAFNRPSPGGIRSTATISSDLKLRDYRSHLGVVLQDNFLFDGTIAENIAYGKPHASRTSQEAARIAYCDEFVEELRDRYDTVVGERGVGCRRPAPARRDRARDPRRPAHPDPRRSHVEPRQRERGMIQDGLRSLRRGRTTFVIAHRLSTIRSADQILVLESGEIVERGSHRELVRLGGRYKQLHDRQCTPGSTDRFVNPGEGPRRTRRARRSVPWGRELNSQLPTANFQLTPTPNSQLPLQKAFTDRRGR
jgi:subfamily B ATP-binding cassette protein MsbA